MQRSLAYLAPIAGVLYAAGCFGVDVGGDGTGGTSSSASGGGHGGASAGSSNASSGATSDTGGTGGTSASSVSSSSGSGSSGSTSGTGGTGGTSASASSASSSSGSSSSAVASSSSGSSSSSAASSSSGSTSSSVASSSSSSSGSTTCAADADCAAGDFCWLATCTRVVAVSAGEDHTCALTRAGSVQCWGSNAVGQLGNNQSVDSAVPVPVSGLSSGVTAIGAGSDHTCAVLSTGSIQCWGYNSQGQLGNGSFDPYSPVPVTVTGLAGGAAAVAGGGAFTCAVTTAGAVQCWGDDSEGELGNNSFNQSRTPVDVVGLSSGVAAIAANYYHACALTTAGGVQCWGSAGNGDLGNGGDTGTNLSVPVAVTGLSSGVTALALGQYHGCALTTGGAMECWGANLTGQLGNDSLTNSGVPTPVPSLTSGVLAIAAGRGFTCVATTGGAAQCWGENLWGELGNGSLTQSKVPVAVTGLSSGASALVGGRAGHTCAILGTGGVECWGLNAHGQLGNGATTNTSTPVAVMEP